MNISDFFSGFRDGMKDFGDNIATIVNSALLLAVYLIGVGLTSIIARIFGKRFLDLRKESRKSYWRDLNLKKKDIEEYYRQF